MVQAFATAAARDIRTRGAFAWDAKTVGVDCPAGLVEAGDAVPFFVLAPALDATDAAIIGFRAAAPCTRREPVVRVAGPNRADPRWVIGP